MRRSTFWTNETFLRRDGKLKKIDKPDDARASFAREWLLLQLRSDWTVRGKTYAAGALLATKLESFLNGDRVFEVLFEPAERKSLVGTEVDAALHFNHRARQGTEPDLRLDAPRSRLAS